ncbi:hypothetical protein S100141_04812 [Bacillus licheniformis]|nr:hypothetical protein S100141_04812 [Bacillus licheniformis]
MYDRRLRRVVLCEAEIDAQSWMTAGVPAIGTGGSSFNQRKADIIVQSPIDHVTIVTDNDKAGEKLRSEVERYLYGKVGLAHGYITEGKDANELLLAKGRAELKAVYERADDVKKWRVSYSTGIPVLKVGGGYINPPCYCRIPRTIRKDLQEHNQVHERYYKLARCLECCGGLRSPLCAVLLNRL